MSRGPSLVQHCVGWAIGFREAAGKRVAGLLLLFTALAQGGCSNLGYYAQSVHGHLQLLSRARSIDEVMRDPATPETLKKKLVVATRIVDFGNSVLGLPDNGSYRKYADLQRPYLVWNVVATPEFSLQPVASCFLVVGCLSYRGYFDKDAAAEFASELAADGHDVWVAGVTAYTTLGWFADPLPNTLLRLPDHHLADTLFHELAHQHTYIADDSAFNEAFATAVGRLGTRLWLMTRSRPAEVAKYDEHLARRGGFLELVWAARKALSAIYDADLPEVEKRRRKQAALDGLGRAYARAKRNWGGHSGYDRWFEENLNNAKLASVAAYHRYVPAFEVMFEENGRDMQAFLVAAAALAEKGKPVRDRYLTERLP